MKDFYTFKVCDFFLSALINSDISSLNDEEENQLSLFEKRAIEQAHNDGFHNLTWDYQDDIGFALCDICGLYGDCVTLNLNVWK